MTPRGNSDAAAELISSVAKVSLFGMVQVVERIDAAEIAGALATMRADPEHVISSTNEADVLGWDAFEAGGPLLPDHVEMRVGPAVTGITDKESLLTLLRRFEEAEGGSVSATKWPWLYWWRPPGLPACLMALLPHPSGGHGLSCIVHIGQTHLNSAFAGWRPEVVQQALKADAAHQLGASVLENERFYSVGCWQTDIPIAAPIHRC
jgi:hypothetical protein